MPSNELDIEAASASEAKLCCSVSHGTSLLEPIPAEVFERDYGSTIAATDDCGTTECC